MLETWAVGREYPAVSSRGRVLVGFTGLNTSTNLLLLSCQNVSIASTLHLSLKTPFDAVQCLVSPEPSLQPLLPWLPVIVFLLVFGPFPLQRPLAA